jgi:hypothetical protein
MAANATLAYTVTLPPRTTAAPTVSLSPNALSGAAGSSGSTTVTVRNNNSASCANEAFNLNGNAPNGWTARTASGADDRPAQPQTLSATAAADQAAGSDTPARGRRRPPQHWQRELHRHAAGLRARRRR